MQLQDEFIFKIAANEWEFSQIHELNYKTFVEEIPQHKNNGSNSLLDKFHDQNTYFICLRKKELIGMIAVRDTRPFSLDCKLKDLDDHLPKSDSICEIRLLSIKKEYRNRKILSGLFSLLGKHCEDNKYDLAIISATTRELSLYKKLGFREFAHLVGEDSALYQPMYITFDSYSEFKKNTNTLKINTKNRANFLPGPATINEEVKKAFECTPISHRSKQFADDFNSTKRLLCGLAGSKNVEILMGSGTLANDVIAANLSLFNSNGLILINGHFGERLIDHAKRFLLNFDTISSKWGAPFDYDEIEKRVIKNKIGWIWFVHCETSTGLLNDLEKLKVISEKYSLKLCADCISSLATYTFNLESIYLASGVSGKAVCSYPGLSFVFYNDYIYKSNKNIPRYLDISYYKSCGGIPFTISSNLVYALKKSLEMIDVKKNCENNALLMSELRNKLDETKVKVITPSQYSSHTYLTFKLPNNLKSISIGAQLEEYGYLLNYRSEYMLEKNLIQIALLGEKPRHEIDNFFTALNKLL
ncbi:MAG: GNAT family N-acetyltransferase [Thermodesulfobacteriota bacterium]